MAIILASGLNWNVMDADGNRHPIKMQNVNSIVTNIKKFVPKFERVVFVANDPKDFELMDAKVDCAMKALEMSGLGFRSGVALDNRNKKNAKKILTEADLIVLTGGKLLRQLEFFKEIGLRGILESHKGLTIGNSAGTMNLCETVCNVPECQEDIDSGEPRWLEGLGFHNEIIMPHFDGEGGVYFDNLCDIDVVEEIMKASFENELIAYNDDSYILLDGGRVGYYGTFYKIKDGTVINLLT